MTEFDETIIDILGKNAYYSTDLKVEDDVRNLVFAVKYLNTQIEQCKIFMEDQGKDHVDDVKKLVIEILKGKAR